MNPSSAWLRRLVTHNWGLKVIAIVLAVISWYGVRDAISFEIVIHDVKVDVQLKEGMAVLDRAPTAVDVTFRGSQDDLQRLDSKQIRAVADLRAVDRRATELVTLEPNDIEGARGVTVLDINPHRIRFVLDKEQGKSAAVKGRIADQAVSRQITNLTVAAMDAPGAPKRIALQPAQVNVRLRGTAEEIKAVDEKALKLFVDCAGLAPGSMRELPVQVFLPGKGGVAVTAEPATVQVTIQE